ncbi:hypothetical protein J6P92_04545 [bacterium]|nr:hypothetical protein [bacterium]
MAPEDNLKVGGVKGRQFFKIDAIAPITYELTKSHVGLSDNATRTSFVGVGNMKLFSFNYNSIGPLNGEPPKTYINDKNGYKELANIGTGIDYYC